MDKEKKKVLRILLYSCQISKFERKKKSKDNSVIIFHTVKISLSLLLHIIFILLRL